MTSSPEGHRPGRGFEIADTRAGTRTPRRFIAAPAEAKGTVRAFRGLDLPTGAESEAARVARESARAAGYAAGWAQGLRQASEQAAAAAQAQQAEWDQADRLHDAQRQAARRRAEEALTHAARALRAERAPSVAELADTVLELALDLAGAVLDREVDLMPSPVRAAVERALRPLDDQLPVTVRVHPDDLSALTGDGRTDGALKDGAAPADAGRVTYLPDASLSPGDAIARQGDTDVDAGLRAAVGRALAALVGPGPGTGGTTAGEPA